MRRRSWARRRLCRTRDVTTAVPQYCHKTKDCYSTPQAVPVRSSMLVGLMSTILKLTLLTSRFHRFTRRSSAEVKVSRSLPKETHKAAQGSGIHK